MNAAGLASGIRPFPLSVRPWRAEAGVPQQADAAKQKGSSAQVSTMPVEASGTKGKGQQPQQPLGSAAPSPPLLPTARAVTPRAGKAREVGSAPRFWRGLPSWPLGAATTHGPDARRGTRTLRQHVDGHVLRPSSPGPLVHPFPRATGQKRDVLPHAPHPSVSSCPLFRQGGRSGHW